MGSLPAERISISRPFTTTGLDFAGPFDIKHFRGRGLRTSKGYLQRDIGWPSQIISDNGRNYVGAAKAIAQDFLAVIKESAEYFLEVHSSWCATHERFVGSLHKNL